VRAVELAEARSVLHELLKESDTPSAERRHTAATIARLHPGLEKEAGNVLAKLRLSHPRYPVFFNATPVFNMGCELALATAPARQRLGAILLLRTTTFARSFDVSRVIPAPAPSCARA
jgi:hypothetical protein